MFCSRCGKTIKAGWTQCAHCKAAVGESRFEGVPYTSAQEKVAPGASIGPEMPEAWQYTRATYTGDYDGQDADMSDAGTTYRPVYNGASVPDEMRHDVRVYIGRETENADEEETPEDAPEAPADAAQDAPAQDIDLDQLENDIEDFDISQIKSRPIVAKKNTGLSSDVEEYVRRLETMDSEERPPRRGKHLAREDAFAPLDDGDADEDIGESDDIYDDDRGMTAGRIVKIVLALVVVAALFVVGIYVAPKLIGKFKKQASAPIEGVTLELYNSGLELIKSHGQDAYKNEVLTIFQNGGYMALTTRLDSDSAAVQALLPAEPSVNDQLFIDAVSALQGDIGNAITLDAVEISSNGSVTSEESAQRWSTIAEALSGFEQINSAAGLSAVVAGERIIADLSTPTPTIAPQASLAPEYKTLSKQDEGEDVKKLQERLWELGYLDDNRDGKFGKNTQTAVKLFQQAAGLEVTGVADNDTQVLLYSDDAPMTDSAQITPAPTVTQEPEQDQTPDDAI
jgi:hypothetical protein